MRTLVKRKYQQVIILFILETICFIISLIFPILAIHLPSLNVLQKFILLPFFALLAFIAFVFIFIKCVYLWADASLLSQATLLLSQENIEVSLNSIEKITVALANRIFINYSNI